LGRIGSGKEGLVLVIGCGGWGLVIGCWLLVTGDKRVITKVIGVAEEKYFMLFLTFIWKEIAGLLPLHSQSNFWTSAAAFV
jgi:hypothetical protein